MAGDPGVHRVLFTNQTPQTVTFVVETSSGQQAAFALIPNGPSKFEEVRTPLTHERYRLVVGDYTNECVSTDELAGLDEVVVEWSDVENKFVLKKIPRKTKERPKSWFPNFLRHRNAGSPRDTLDV